MKFTWKQQEKQRNRSKARKNWKNRRVFVVENPENLMKKMLSKWKIYLSFNLFLKNYKNTITLIRIR